MTLLWLVAIPPWLFVHFAVGNFVADWTLIHGSTWWSFPLWMTFGLCLLASMIGGIFFALILAGVVSLPA